MFLNIMIRISSVIFDMVMVFWKIMIDLSSDFGLRVCISFNKFVGIVWILQMSCVCWEMFKISQGMDVMEIEVIDMNINLILNWN